MNDLIPPSKNTRFTLGESIRTRYGHRKYFGFYLLDKYGYPVETIMGRPITNFIRLLLHTRKIAKKENDR